MDREAQPRLGLGRDAGALEASLEDEVADGAGAEGDVAVGRSADADALRTDGDESVVHASRRRNARRGAGERARRKIVLSPMKVAVKRVRGRR